MPVAATFFPSRWICLDHSPVGTSEAEQPHGREARERGSPVRATTKGNRHMTERPYETSVPDEVVIPAAPAYPVQGSSNGEGTSVGNEAKSVASDAADSGRQVAETAASGVKDVASEATTQLRQLLDQVRSELDDQASTQGQRAADGLRSLAGELRQMASSSQEQGIAGEVAGQAADRAASFADWLEHRQPGDMLDELRSLARRRPGAFLL